MKFLRFAILFLILSGWSISAWNLDSRRFTLEDAGPIQVRALLVDGDGIKWFGTDQGLYRYDNLNWSHFTDADFLVGNKVSGLENVSSEDGSVLWVATDRGVTSLLYDSEGVNKAYNFTTEDGLLDDSIVDLAIDPDHVKYFGSLSGVSVFYDDSVDYLTYDDYPLSMVNAPVDNLLLHHDTLYIGTEGGVGRFVSGVDGISGATKWTNQYGITPLSENIQTIFVDSRGHQWFGTDMGAEEHVGLQAKENWIVYTTLDGLVNDNVLAIAEDEAGGMWFGTGGGVSYLNDQEWTSFTREDGLASDTVYDIAFDNDGSVWFATQRGVSQLTDMTFNSHLTDHPEKRAEHSPMKAWYDSYRDEIRIIFEAHIPGSVFSELYSRDGKLCLRSRHEISAAGNQAIYLSPAKQGISLETGIYITRIVIRGISVSQKIVITR